MMADSIEHVISYWIMFQKFHSPALGGFAMLSHWLPFLFFSVYSGALADRFDPRRIIQVGMLCFMAASLGWGLLFLTDSLEMWHAMALLVLHGFAGVLWHPSAQLLIHDIVGTANLQSAVRLGATARYLGLLFGPAVGGAFLIAFGPAHAILLNAAIYLPLMGWLWKAPYGPRFRKGEPAPLRAVKGLSDIPDLSYSMLLAADAAGALFAGVLLESRGLLQARPRTACVLAMLWCLAIGGFAASSSYPLALVLLFGVGFLELSFNAMAQTLVQLRAPAPIRGRVIGLYLLSGLGMRAFSGVTIGFVGGLIGIHWSLALSALVLLAVIAALLAFTLRRAA